MTEGTPWKHIVRFAMPVLAGSLLQQLYNTVDAIVVGKFAGEAALSAVGTTGSFAFLFLALALGFSAGNGVVVAQQFGAGNEKEVRVNASTGILFLMMLGAAAAVIGIVLARPAYTLLVNVPESFLDLTLQYFRIYAVGLIFQYGYNIFSSILTLGRRRSGGRDRYRAGCFVCRGLSLYDAEISDIPLWPAGIYLERQVRAADCPRRLSDCTAADHCLDGTDTDPACCKRFRTADDSVLYCRAADRDVPEPALQRLSDHAGNLYRPEHRRWQDGPGKDRRPADTADFAGDDACHLGYGLDFFRENHRPVRTGQPGSGILHSTYQNRRIYQRHIIPVCTAVRRLSGGEPQRLPNDCGYVRAQYARVCYLSVPVQQPVRAYDYLVERTVWIQHGLHGCMDLLSERALAAECKTLMIHDGGRI